MTLQNAAFEALTRGLSGCLRASQLGQAEDRERAAGRRRNPRGYADGVK